MTTKNNMEQVKMNKTEKYRIALEEAKTSLYQYTVLGGEETSHAQHAQEAISKINETLRELS